MPLKFRHGKPTMINYTATADRTGGEVVAGSGQIPSLIYHRDAKNGTIEEAAVAIGGGIYEGVAAEAIAFGAAVSYVTATGKLAAVGDIGPFIATSAASADGDAVYVLQPEPDGA